MANTFIFDDDDQQSNVGEPMPEPGDDQPPGGEGSNRTFLIAAIVLGGIFLLSLICMAVYAVVILPQSRAAQLSAEAANAAAFTQTAIVNQQTAEAALATPTLSPTPVFTDAPSATPVVVFASATPTGLLTQDPATATVEALQTQLASAQLTATFLPSATAGTAVNQLSRTGFADEIGLPGLFIAALILMAVILLARRLRGTPTRS